MAGTTIAELQELGAWKSDKPGDELCLAHAMRIDARWKNVSATAPQKNIAGPERIEETMLRVFQYAAQSSSYPESDAVHPAALASRSG